MKLTQNPTAIYASHQQVLSPPHPAISQPGYLTQNQADFYSSHQLIHHQDQDQYQVQMQPRQHIPKLQIVPNPLPPSYNCNQYQQISQVHQEVPIYNTIGMSMKNTVQKISQVPHDVRFQIDPAISQQVQQPIQQPQVNSLPPIYASHQIYQNMDQLPPQNYQSHQNLQHIIPQTFQTTESKPTNPIYSNHQEIIPHVLNQRLQASYSQNKLDDQMMFNDFSAYQQAIVSGQLGLRSEQQEFYQNKMSPLEILKILMEDKDSGPAVLRLKKLMGNKAVSKKKNRFM